MQYIASLSYGKDSLYMLEIIHQNNLPLDRIVHAEIMATETIPADLPEMMKFKNKADQIIFNKYRIKVERIHPPYAYEEYFYKKCVKGKHKGAIHGFPMTQKRMAWCNKRLKIEPMQKLKNKKDAIWYLGIAADEPNRFGNLTENRISPLVEYNIFEKDCYNWCKDNNLLSPIYSTSMRGGCWFCHNQPLQQLRMLRKNYPKYWQLLLKWDEDSPVTFRTNSTVHDLDKRFELEERQISLIDLGMEV